MVVGFLDEMTSHGRRGIFNNSYETVHCSSFALYSMLFIKLYELILFHACLFFAGFECAEANDT